MDEPTKGASGAAQSPASAPKGPRHETRPKRGLRAAFKRVLQGSEYRWNPRPLSGDDVLIRTMAELIGRKRDRPSRGWRRHARRMKEAVRRGQ